MTESTTVSISDLEARLVYVIHRELGYKVGEIFTPFVTLKSETDRHTFDQLVEHNLFIKVANNPARFMLTQNALEAYDAWASRQPYQLKTPRVVPNPSDVLIADPLTDYRGALKEIMTIIEDHDANPNDENTDSILTEIYQLIEHIIDLHELTQE